MKGRGWKSTDAVSEIGDGVITLFPFKEIFVKVWRIGSV